MNRTMTAADLLRFELAANPVLSPDGTLVVYERTVADEQDDGYCTQLMLAATDGSDTRPLTSGGKSNIGAVWSPDGRAIAFLSDRAYGTQAWLLRVDGGEANRITRFRHGVSALAWSADGRTLYAIVAAEDNADVQVWPDDCSSKEASEQSEQQDKEWAKSPKRFTRLYYKNDGAGLDKLRHGQLVAVDVASASVRQLTHGDADIDALAVSPDGQTIAFVSNRRANRHVEWWGTDIHTVPAAGGEVSLLHAGISAASLAWSPDGEWLAVTGVADTLFQFWSAAHTKLFLLPATGGPEMELSADFPDTLGDTTLSDVRADVRDHGVVWSKDGRHLYALSSREGRSEVVRFSVAASGQRVAAVEVVIGGDRDVYGFAFDGRHTFVITYGTPMQPSQVAVVDAVAFAPQYRQPRAVAEPMKRAPTAAFPVAEVRLDADNAWLTEIDMVAAEPFWYTSEGGWQMQGWVLKPPRLAADAKAPVLLEIHGGPQLNYGYMMFHEMQWFAAQGYAVVFTNPRGGMSYGQEFADAVRGHYGGGDAADVQHGLDAALSSYSFPDGDRVAVTGGSYGGFMTNWLVGHSDRFFAAVAQRSISNWISFYGTADCGPAFLESQFDVVTLDDRAQLEALWRMSPLAYARNVRTPLLLLHSEQDLRCPMEQAEQFYSSVKRHGGEVELLRIPNASHGLSRNGKPSLRLARLEAMLRFLQDRLPPA